MPFFYLQISLAKNFKRIIDFLPHQNLPIPLFKLPFFIHILSEKTS